MKKYEDPEMNVVLFDDKVFVANLQGESNLAPGDGTTIKIEETDHLDDGEWFN